MSEIPHQDRLRNRLSRLNEQAAHARHTHPSLRVHSPFSSVKESERLPRLRKMNLLFVRPEEVVICRVSYELRLTYSAGGRGNSSSSSI